MNNQDFLKKIRSQFFSEGEISDPVINRYIGQISEKIKSERAKSNGKLDKSELDKIKKEAESVVREAVKTVREQMQPVIFPDIKFVDIINLHQYRNRIDQLISKHQEYLLNEFQGDKPFDRLSSAFEKSNNNKENISAYIKYLEDRAKKQETKDTSDKLHETIRNFATSCRKFLLDSKYEPAYPLFTKKYEDIVSKINEVKKVGFNTIDYRDLAEECYTQLNEITNDKQAFQFIMLLINLKCAGLGVAIPSVKATTLCPECDDKEQFGNICTKCHSYIKCPGCQQTIVKDAKICGGCGVEIDKIDTWVKQIKSAGEKIATKDYIAAEQAIKPIKTIWTKYEPLNLICSQIDVLKEQSIEYDKRMNVLLNERKYFSASALLVEMKQKAPHSSHIQEAEARIKDTIDHVQKLFEETATIIPVEKQVEAYTRILMLAADFPAVIERLRQMEFKMPPLTVEIQGSTVLLKWVELSIPNASVEYIVTRKEKSSPSITDHRIYSGNANTCIDNNILPGISYFYGLSVNVNIQGVDIQPTSPSLSSEILITVDVSKYDITTGDKYIQIDFENIPGVSDYILYRESEKEEKIQIDDNLKTGIITDRNVVNGVRYAYTLVSVFKKTNGEIVQSEGLKLYATPQIPPKPITSLKYIKEEKNIILSWETEEKSASNIRILESEFKLNKSAGSLVPVKELEQSGKLLTTTLPNHLIITSNNSRAKNYFSIWTVGSGTLMFGSEVEIVNIEEVSELNTYIRSGKLYVEWKWPGNCNQVKVSFSNTSFDDAKKITKNYSRELYEKQLAFIIEPIVNKDYFIEVQTLKLENNKEILSSASKKIVRNSDSEKEERKERREENVKATKGNSKWIFLLIGLIILGGGGFGLYLMLSKDKSAIEQPVIEQPLADKSESLLVKPESTSETSTNVTEKKQDITPSSNENTISNSETGDLNLGYATYKGIIKNGKANGKGTLTFLSARRLSANDEQARTADAGDYFEGQFVNNEPYIGRWYDKNGKQKGTLINKK